MEVPTEIKFDIKKGKELFEGKEKRAPWNTGDLWVCEEHPDRLWPDNDPDCIGPGMPALTERERSLMKQAREYGKQEKG